jgi:lysophospholipase L1-like esterase
VLANYARARNIPMVDLLPELVATGRSERDLFIDHDHLSVEGHRAVAAILAPRLTQILAARTTQEVSP